MSTSCRCPGVSSLSVSNMVGLLVTVWLVMSIQLSSSDIGVQQSGPYTIVFERITKCDDEGTGEVVFGTKITKSQDGRYMYNSPLYFGLPIDEDIKIDMELQSFSNGGYRPRFMHYVFKGCEETWKYFKSLWQIFFQVAGVTGVDKCPVPAGNYILKDYDLNSFNMTKFPVMIYKRYRVFLTFFHKKKKIGCTQWYVEVVPK